MKFVEILNSTSFFVNKVAIKAQEIVIDTTIDMANQHSIYR